MDQAERNDRSEIRDLIEGWVVYRDTGDWERLLAIFHEDGRMETTWTQSSAKDFVESSRVAALRGVRGGHSLQGTTMDLAGPRAVSQTKMTITQRAEVEGVLCDVTCSGRFYDFWERRSERWGLVLRQPIYERDRIDPLVPGTCVPLDQDLLSRFPEGYQHLAYLQTRAGLTVKDDMPGLSGPPTDALYRRGADWLAAGRG